MLTVNRGKISYIRERCPLVWRVVIVLAFIVTLVKSKGLGIRRKKLVESEFDPNRGRENRLGWWTRICCLPAKLLLLPERLQNDSCTWDFCVQPTHIGAHVRVAILHLLAHMGFHPTRSLAGRSRLALMARNPFTYDRDPGHPEDSEFGFGRGKFPDPNIDFTDNGIKSRIPIADPDHRDQMLTLAMVRRMDINDPNDQPSPYVAGNTDRYGAQPPLVRERRAPKYTRPKQTPPQRMKRSW